jgi:hypothetical protein
MSSFSIRFFGTPYLLKASALCLPAATLAAGDHYAAHATDTDRNFRGVRAAHDTPSSSPFSRFWLLTLDLLGLVKRHAVQGPRS